MTINRHIEEVQSLEQRNAKFLHVTAYENVLSDTASSFLNSRLSERYYFGGGGEDSIVNWDPFTCLGLQGVEDLVTAAELAVGRMMGAEVVNLRCLSGVHAMMCAILVATNPGDRIMIVGHDDGGHFSTAPIIERTGRFASYATYDDIKLKFDAKATAKTYHETNCKALYLDISYCLSTVNLRELRQELGADAIIIYDASHTIGLMMGGQFQSPFAEGADIVCANTHKTLPGPHKGMILFKDKDHGEKLNAVINNGLFSTSHTQHLIALAITILEMEAYGNKYATQIIRNSNALGQAFSQLGRPVRAIARDVYSQTHQVHLYLPTDTGGLALYKRLIENSISTNFDNRLGGKLFARLGTQELTRRGMVEKDMETIARLLDLALKGVKVRQEVEAFNGRFTDVKYSFDQITVS